MSFQEPLISVVTVCRDAAATIGATAEGVRAQRYRDFEWIVIDGASTDSTLALLAPFRTRIAHLVSEPDDGIYDAMNKGLRLARGRYVFFLNADDLFATADVLAQIAPWLRAGRRLVWGNVIQWDSVTATSRRAGGSGGFWDAVRCSLPHHQGVFLERRWALTAGGFDVRYGLSADIHLIGRALGGPVAQRLHLELDVARFRLGGASDGVELTVRGVWDRARAIFGAFGLVVGVLHCVYLCYFLPRAAASRIRRITALDKLRRQQGKDSSPHA